MTRRKISSRQEARRGPLERRITLSVYKSLVIHRICSRQILYVALLRVTRQQMLSLCYDLVSALRP